MLTIERDRDGRRAWAWQTGRRRATAARVAIHVGAVALIAVLGMAHRCGPAAPSPEPCPECPAPEPPPPCPECPPPPPCPECPAPVDVDEVRRAAIEDYAHAVETVCVFGPSVHAAGDVDGEVKRRVAVVLRDALLARVDHPARRLRCR